ncbi:hypothetical protein [Burkholderia anthina]|nr:hypothetical protein [Burkholderia anthina]
MKIVSLKKLLTAALIGASFVAATSHAALIAVPDNSELHCLSAGS